MIETEKQIAAILRIIEERDEARKNIVTIAEIRDNAVKQLESVRVVLNSPYGDDVPTLDVHEAAQRVVAERYEARRNARAPAPLPPGWGTEDLLNIGKILNRAYDETPTQAAERVVKERDALRADVERLNGEKIGTYLMKLRTLLGAPKDEDTHVAVERVVAERDEALRLKSCSDEIISIREYLGSTDQEPNTLGQVKRIVKSKDRAVTERDEAQKRAETFRMQLESHERMSANLRSILGHPQVALEEAARWVVQECRESKVFRKNIREALGLTGLCTEDDLLTEAKRVVKELQETRSVLGARNDEAADAVALRMIKLGLDFKSERDAAKDEVNRLVKESIDMKQRLETRHRAFEELDTARARIAELEEHLRQAHASRSLLQEQFASMRVERDEAQKHNEHLLTSVAHEQNLASKVLKELEEANLARAELSASLEKAVAGRDELQQNLDAATKMLNDMNEAVQSVVKERDALFPSNDPNNPRLELEGFRKGDLVSTPNQKEYVPIERVGIGHGGFWYVYVNGGWEPQALVRKPIAKGDMARCVSGPFEGETVRVVGVDANYVEMVREGHLGTVHVIALCQAVAVAS